MTPSARPEVVKPVLPEQSFQVAAALEAGGRLADDSHVPQWWTLASPENHGVDIAAWPDFEDDVED